MCVKCFSEFFKATLMFTRLTCAADVDLCIFSNCSAFGLLFTVSSEMECGHEAEFYSKQCVYKIMKIVRSTNKLITPVQQLGVFILEVFCLHVGFFSQIQR